MTRKQDNAKGRITAEDLKKLLAEDRDLLKTIIEETLQQVLEAEMDKRTAHALVIHLSGQVLSASRPGQRVPPSCVPVSAQP